MALYDVIVIGAGIEGSSSAYHLAKKGNKVLLLEQFPLPHIRGSSHGQSRITRYAYGDDFYVHMMTDAFPMWAKLEEESGEDFFVNCGVLDFRTVGSKGFESVSNALSTHKVPHECLSSKELNSRFPAFHVDKQIGAVFDPSGGLLRADRALRAFQTVFKQMGGIIKDNCQVTSIIPGDTVKVITTSAIYLAKSIVIAAGAWAGKFAKALELNIPLKPIKVTVLYWKAAEDKLDVHQVTRMPCFIDSTADEGFHIYGFPCEDYPGLVKVCLHNGPEIDPDDRDNVDTEWTMQKVKEYKKICPWLSDTPSIREYCIYTMTPDEHPYIDRHPKFPNIVIAAGFSGHGFKLSPAVGNAVSDLVLGNNPSYNMKPFKLDRFATKAHL